MLSFREWLRENFGSRPRRVKTPEDVARVARNSNSGEVKVVIDHDTGQAYASPGEDTDHSQMAATIRKTPKKISGGTIYHDRDGPTADHSEWSSIKSNPTDFFNHQLIKQYKKRDDY